MAQLDAQFPWNLGGSANSSETPTVLNSTPRLAEYLKGKPNLEAVLDALGVRFADLAAVGTELDEDRRLENAAGAQLDVIGKIVGQAREGADDSTYYRRIRGRILANRSSGTVQEIYEVLALVLPLGAAFHIEDAYPAGFNVYLTSTDLNASDADRLVSFLAVVRAAGVRGIFFWRSADAADTFTLDGTPAQALDAGIFANAALYPGAH